MKNVYDIIRRPVITEQSMEAVADKKYVFMVDVESNKTEIKAAVEQIFGVKVAKINTVRMQGKIKRTGAYPAGKRAEYKKAIVTLTADSKTIEFFEGMVYTKSQRRQNLSVAWLRPSRRMQVATPTVTSPSAIRAAETSASTASLISSARSWICLPPCSASSMTPTAPLSSR